MSLLSSLGDFLKPAAPPDPAVEQALARIGELVDPLLKLAPGFERHLGAPVSHALAYCAGLVDALPGPLAINRQAFASDPLIHALFATADDIDQMLGRSQAIRDFLAEPANRDDAHFYAMLAARRQQKKQFGMTQRGELVENDVPQVVLYFSGQTLIEPSCDLAATRQQLRDRALESLLHSFHSHVDSLRQERESLRADAAQQRSHLTVLHGSTPGQEYRVATRHLADLDARLRQSAESLMPEPLIEALAAFLCTPESALKLAPVSITIDRLGIVSETPSDDPAAQTINFPELCARDQRLHLAMLVRISRDEALAAVDRVRDQQQRFMLI